MPRIVLAACDISGCARVHYLCTVLRIVFTTNEQLLLEQLRNHPPTDLATLAERCGLARSSTHVALSHLVELGVVDARRRGDERTTTYQIAARDAIERAAQKVLADFRKVLYPTEYGAVRPRLVFTDSYVLPENQLQQLRSRYEVVTFEHSPEYAGAQLLELRSQDADVIVRFDFQTIDRAFLEKMPRLKAVVSPNCVLHNLDQDACAEFGVQVVSIDIVTEKYYATTQHEYVINALLTLLKPLHRAGQAVSKSGRYFWGDHLGNELGNKRVGVYFKSSNITKMLDVFRAFGCEVAAANLLDSAPQAATFGLPGYRTVEELWDWADVAVMIDELELVLDPLFGRGHSPHYFVIGTTAVRYDLGLLRSQLLDHKVLGFAADYLPDMFISYAHQQDLQQALRPIINLPNVLLTPELSVFSEESMQRNHDLTFQKLMELQL